MGIIGANGSGKSTLLDLIAGRRQPQQGRLELGSTVRVAYFDQQAEGLSSDRGLERKLIDYVQEEASRIEVDGVAVSASQLLERFLFPPPSSTARSDDSPAANGGGSTSAGC